MLLLLPLLPLIALLGLRLLETLRGALRGLGDEEYDFDLPRLAGGPRPLLGDMDLDRERAGLLIGERLRRRPTGDLLGGLRACLGDRRLGGSGERRRTGLPRTRRGEPLGGDLRRLGGELGERPLTGDVGLLLGGGESPLLKGESARRRTGESARRRGGGGGGGRGGESGSLLGEPLRAIGEALRATGDLLRGGERGFRRGDDSL